MQKYNKVIGICALVIAFGFTIKFGWVMHSLRNCTDDTCPFMIAELPLALAFVIIGVVFLLLERIKRIGKFATIFSILMLLGAIYQIYVFSSLM